MGNELMKTTREIITNQKGKRFLRKMPKPKLEALPEGHHHYKIYRLMV